MINSAWASGRRRPVKPRSWAARPRVPISLGDASALGRGRFSFVSVHRPEGRVLRNRAHPPLGASGTANCTLQDNPMRQLPRVVFPLLAVGLATALLAGCSSVRELLRPSAPPAAATGTRQTVRAETVLTGLEVPWALAWAPDGRLFLTERVGR